MKKFIALLCAGVMAASAAACSSQAPSAAASPEASTEAPATEAPTEAPAAEAPTEAPAAELKVAVFYYTYSDAYISSVRASLDEILNSGGVQYLNIDSNNNQATQNEQIDTAISQGYNLLVVNIVTSGSTDVAQQIIDKASAAGIPVIFFNRALGVDNNEAPILAGYADSVFVGTNAPEAGHMQGQLIGEYLLANYEKTDLNSDGTISYAMFKGDEANVEAIYRTQYGQEDADAVLTAAGKPALSYFDPNNTNKYQVDMGGNWSAAAANEYMVTNLSQYNESNGNMIELVICNNDAMAEGVVSALNDSGYNLGTDDSKYIPVFGVDATDAAKQLIGEGKMTGTIKQDNVGMAEGIFFFIKNIQDGNPLTDGIGSFNTDPEIPTKVFIPYGVYTGE
ncbi:MAG: galactose ABC transporter substrate-binding protein [Clostridiales bacterium]|jgi:methyl-galactoside transport system substrate-binding protein|nr:galactose ABC transporter substrate-binding protein [Clostridiales bacterium]